MRKDYFKIHFQQPLGSNICVPLSYFFAIEHYEGLKGENLAEDAVVDYFGHFSEYLRQIINEAETNGCIKQDSQFRTKIVDYLDNCKNSEITGDILYEIASNALHYYCIDIRNGISGYEAISMWHNYLTEHGLILGGTLHQVDFKIVDTCYRNASEVDNTKLRKVLGSSNSSVALCLFHPKDSASAHSVLVFEEGGYYYFRDPEANSAQKHTASDLTFSDIKITEFLLFDIADNT